jgi:diguanylate cyclase (GGDEF)-like protein
VPRRTPARPVGPSDRFVAVTDPLLAPVVLLSRSAHIEYVNSAAAGLLHRERGLLLGRQFAELTHPADRARLRAMVRSVGAGRPTGRTVRLRVRANEALDWRVLDCTADNMLEDADVRGILLSIYDVTESQAENLALAAIAFHDPLTGLPNRAKVVAELERLLSLEGDVAVGLIAMDRLSLAEDSLGRTGADGFIKAVGRRILAGLPRDATLARLEGGTFATILPAALASDATAMAWRIVEQALGPLFVGSQELSTSVSVGLAIRDANATVESLLWDAGLALHRAEARGGGRVEMFSNGHRREVLARLELEAELRRAVATRTMSLAFQPIVRLSDRTATAAEALLRWHHPAATSSRSSSSPLPKSPGSSSRSANGSPKRPRGSPASSVAAGPRSTSRRASSRRRRSPGSWTGSSPPAENGDASSSRSPRACSSSSGSTRRASSPISDASAIAWAWMTSGPATRPSPTCGGCRLTS